MNFQHCSDLVRFDLVFLNDYEGLFALFSVIKYTAKLSFPLIFSLFVIHYIKTCLLVIPIYTHSLYACYCAIRLKIAPTQIIFMETSDVVHNALLPNKINLNMNCISLRIYIKKAFSTMKIYRYKFIKLDTSKLYSSKFEYKYREN